MLEDIRLRNEELIIKYSNNIDKLARQKIIKQLLNDDKCFFKINVIDAYNILTDLEYNEKELEDIYMNLISYNNL